MKSVGLTAVLRWMLMLGIVGVLSSCATGDGEKEMVDPVAPTGDVAPPPEDPPMGDMDVPSTDGVVDPSQLTVYFDFDDYSLSADAQTNLDSIKQYLEENGDSRMTLEGHCDSFGTGEYNLALGQKRADAVKTHLMQFGIDEGRLGTVSHGEEKLAVPDARTIAEHAPNRRVEFVLQ